MGIAMIIEAYELAKCAHINQKRKTGEPYITHSIAVADIANKYTQDEDVLIACLLHDTVEDTHITLDDIRSRFGSGVSFLVDAVTKPGYPPHPQMTFYKVKEYASKDDRVIIIKLADRVHNTSTGLESTNPSLDSMKEKYKIWSPHYAELGLSSPYKELAEELIKLTSKL